MEPISLYRNLVELCSLLFKVWLGKFAEWPQSLFFVGDSQTFAGYTENMSSNMFVQPPFFSLLRNFAPKLDNFLKTLIILKEAFHQSPFSSGQTVLSQGWRKQCKNHRFKSLHSTCLHVPSDCIHHWDDLLSVLHKKSVFSFHFVVDFRLGLQFNCPCSSRPGVSSLIPQLCSQVLSQVPCTGYELWALSTIFCFISSQCPAASRRYSCSMHKLTRVSQHQ